MAGPNLQGPRSNNNPDPMSEYVRRLVDLQRQLNDLTGSVLKSAGIDVSPDGMTINSALDVLGSAVLGGDTDVSGALGVTGAMTVGGTMTVTGDATFQGNLAVPNGSITNANLANLSSPTTGNAAQSGITFSTGAVAYATAAFIVPAGFTSAAVMGASAGFWGGSAGTALQMYTRIAGADGPAMTSAIGSSGFANIASSYATQFAVTGGTSFSVQTVALYAGGGAPTGALTTSAVVFFYR